MYIAAINAPAAYTARGKVRCGSRTSALIAETSSRPVNAKAICDQKFTVSQFHTGITLPKLKCVTEPCRTNSKPATATSMSKGRYVATPPAFCSHLPILSPRSEEHTSELQSRQYLVCRLLLEKKKNTSNTN